MTFNNADVLFLEQKLIWRSYTAAQGLFTTKRIKFINKKKIAKVVLDENVEAFMIYVISFRLSKNLIMIIHLAKKTLIAFTIY